MDFGIAGVAVITVIAYLVGMIAKSISQLNNKWVPVICAATGGILGVVAMYTMEAFPATDLLSAIAVGIVSGLAATGVNQTVKQLKENKTEVTQDA